MAAINDLIAQIQDVELRNKIEQEVNRMNKQKKFCSHSAEQLIKES